MNYTPTELAAELRIRAAGGHEGHKELEIMCALAADALERAEAMADLLDRLGAEYRKSCPIAVDPEIGFSGIRMSHINAALAAYREASHG